MSDAPAGQRVDFYVLEGADDRAWLKLACRVAEKAALAGQRVYAWSEDDALLERFDELLWTFGDRSFVPHERFESASQWEDTPVLLGSGAQTPEIAFDVLLNLGTRVPPVASLAQRVAEIIDSHEQRRQAGRERYKHYRASGLAPETHNIAAS